MEEKIEREERKIDRIEEEMKLKLGKKKRKEVEVEVLKKLVEILKIEKSLVKDGKSVI